MVTISTHELAAIAGGLGSHPADKYVLPALGAAAVWAVGVNVWCARGDHKQTHPRLCGTATREPTQP